MDIDHTPSNVQANNDTISSSASDAEFWNLLAGPAKTLTKFGKLSDCPHIIVSGASGVGKTTLVNAWLCSLYGVTDLVDTIDLLHLDNFRCTYGLDMIRKVVKPFLKRQSSSSTEPKRIFLDDAQHLTSEAQNALVRMLEIYMHSSRLVIVTDNYEGMNAALKSRCMAIHLETPPSSVIKLYAEWYGSNFSFYHETSVLIQYASASATIGDFLKRVRKHNVSSKDNAAVVREEFASCLHQMLSLIKSWPAVSVASVQTSKILLCERANLQREALLLCNACAQYVRANILDLEHKVGLIRLLIEIEASFLNDSLCSHASGLISKFESLL